MKIVILHSELALEAGKDELDVLEQIQVVSDALDKMNYPVQVLPFTLNLAEIAEKLQSTRPSLVFNLVETVTGSGRLIYLAPALLDHLQIPYTGSTTEAVFLTSNKVVAKKLLRATGIKTPVWFRREDLPLGEVTRPDGTFIIKSVWEHASIGLDEGSVVRVNGWNSLAREIDRRRQNMGGEAFAEAYVDGREFNLSIIADNNGNPEVLPPAEIRFDRYPEGKRRVVDYRAKWETESFEYLNTPRRFQFTEEDRPLLHELKEVALQCWRLFGLRGYARVDFRVDRSGTPWVLEVNTNPCLSPDAGFAAACQEAGLSVEQMVARIIQWPLAEANRLDFASLAFTPCQHVS